MLALKTYVGFISHAWRYHDDYARLEQMLLRAPNFLFRNSSVSRTDPVLGIRSTQQLTNALDEQIRIANIVLILGGMYAAHSDWIDTEINIAKSYRKPIIGVVPWGQLRVPEVVRQAASDTVHWNTDSIVSAIRQYAL